MNDGIVTPAGKDITLKEYAQQWLEARRGIIAVRTIRCYDDCLSNYVLPKLGHLKVRQITTAQLLPWLTSLKANGFSVNTLRLARATLSACLGHAVLEGLTETNAMMYLSKQKTAQPGKLTKADRDDKIRPFESPEQFDRFLAVALHPSFAPWGRAWELMGRCGLRPSEGFALKPGDVDLVAKTLRVERSLDHDRSTKPTKTSERRTVRLSDVAVASLKKHLTWVKTETLKRGWGEPAWLFPNPQNEPLKAKTGQKSFPTLCRRAGVPEHSAYDLRHSFATWMLQAGVPLGYVSKQLGHKNPSTTLKFYYHWVKDDGRDQGYANALEPDSGTKAPQRVVSMGSSSDQTAESS